MISSKKGKTNFDSERVLIEGSVAKLEQEVNDLSTSSLDFQQFALGFVDSPPTHDPDLDLLLENVSASNANVSTGPLPTSNKVRFNQCGFNFSIIKARQLDRLKGWSFLQIVDEHHIVETSADLLLIALEVDVS